MPAICSSLRARRAARSRTGAGPNNACWNWCDARWLLPRNVMPRNRRELPANGAWTPRREPERTNGCAGACDRTIEGRSMIDWRERFVAFAIRFLASVRGVQTAGAAWKGFWTALIDTDTG